MTDVGITPTGNIFLDTIDPDTDPNAVVPTSQINGSSTGTTVPDGVGNADVPTNAELADALFPFFDGVNETLASNPISQDGLTEYLFPGTSPTLTPDTDANGNPLTPEQLFANTQLLTADTSAIPVEDFYGFHSSHQLEYVLQFGDPVPGAPDARVVTFEQDGNRFDIVAVPGGTRVFTLQQLTTADLATFSAETQVALAAAVDDLDDVLQAQIESVIGAAAGDTVEGALEVLIDDAIAEIEGYFTLDGALDFDDAEITEFRNVFLNQIENIETRAESSSFIDLTEIGTRVDEILRRAKRANEFFIVAQTPPEEAEGDRFGGTQFINVNAPVNEDISQSGILDSFNVFIAQETRIRDLDNQRLQLASTGALSGRALDGPTLIAILQLNYNLTREAEVNLETEELNQQNALLQVYAAVQQLVNDALRVFEPGDEGASQTLTITGENSDDIDYNSLTQTEQNLIAFVEDFLVSNSTVGHPIESLRNINRPTLDIIDNREGTLNEFSQNSLNIFASQLADTVTQINQESQILTNEISSINRERNRNFDLANNALRRLNDTLLTIART